MGNLRYDEEVFPRIGKIISDAWNTLMTGGTAAVTGIVQAIKGETGMEVDPSVLQQLAVQATDAADFTDRLKMQMQTEQQGQGPIIGKQPVAQTEPATGKRQAPVQSWYDVEKRQVPKKKRGNSILD